MIGQSETDTERIIEAMRAEFDALKESEVGFTEEDAEAERQAIANAVADELAARLTP